jgi:hypothetical protein
MSNDDVIDRLAGLAPGSPLAMIRDRKPVTRQQAQCSYQALFEAADTGDVTLQERFALACFVAGLHAEDAGAAFYAAGLANTAPAADFVAALSDEVSRGRAVGRGRSGLRGGGSRSFRARRAPVGRAGTRSFAGFPSARRLCLRAATSARCRLVKRRHCDAVATGCIPVVSASRRRRPANPGRHRGMRTVP